VKRLLLVALLIGIVLAGLVVSPIQAAGPNDYVVQPGDTLYAIAARYGVNINDLAAINGLAGNSAIHPGQSLGIPLSQPMQPIVPQFVYAVPPAAAAYPTFYPNPVPMWGQPLGAPQPVNNSTYNTYIVQPGDTLFGLAQRYGVDVAALQAANGHFDLNPIVAGQSLIIPGVMPAPVGPGILNQPALPTPPTWSINSPNFYSTSAPRFAPPTRPTGPERWIDVDLTHQTLTAFEGQGPVYRTRVSSGLPQYPTVVGTFQIYVKYESADMEGGSGADAYYLPAVPYVMYFHGNYGLHGTYWHNNFGRPMSHGCVNLSTPDAQWLFNWASIGTRVVTHY
jgi:LysM repeat protein